MMTPEYLTLKDLAAYASVCRNTLKKWQDCGMPVYQVGGVLRVKRSEFDAWMRQFLIGTESKDLDTIFDQVLEEVAA
jgi:excisionase family DNA binding protein